MLSDYDEFEYDVFDAWNTLVNDDIHNKFVWWNMCSANGVVQILGHKLKTLPKI